MRKLLLILVGIWISMSVSAQGIEFFHGTFEEAMKKARTQNKKIFVDVYTSWCGPCKMMAKNVFPDEKVGKYYKDRFVCLKLDAEKESGHGFFKNYKANGYPSFFWLNADGKLLDVHVGYVEADRFLEITGVAETSDLNWRLEEGQKRWSEGERTPELVDEYLLGVMSRVKPDEVKPLMMQYLKGLPEEQLLKKENYLFLRMFMREAGDNFVFRTLMKYADVYQQYEKNYDFWINMYRMAVRSGIIYRSEPEKYREYLGFLTGLKLSLADMYHEILGVEYNLFLKDFSVAIPDAMATVSKYEKEHPYLAGQFLYTLIIAGFYQEPSVDEKLADQVIVMADKALKVLPSKENLLYLSVAYARKGDYKKAYQLMASEPFFSEPMLSNALYKYLDLPVFHREYMK